MRKVPLFFYGIAEPSRPTLNLSLMRFNTAHGEKIMQMKKLAAALMLAGLACAVAAEEVRVAVAANFMAPMKELAPLYEKATGDKLVVSYGATGAFYAQIKNGAPFDVLLAADAKTPAKAVKEGHGVAGTTFTYAVGKLVLWSSDAALVKDQKALLHPTVKKVAVADARLAPYGEAALQALDALKMKEAVEPKFVVSNNIGKTFQFVESGNTQIGFVALSQCFKNGAFTGGSGWVVPQDLYKPILQDAVQLKAGEKNAGAKRFLDYLKTSNEATAIREAYGYGTVR